MSESGLIPRLTNHARRGDRPRTFESLHHAISTVWRWLAEQGQRLQPLTSRAPQASGAANPVGHPPDEPDPPDDHRVLHKLGLRLHQQGQWDEAIAAYAGALRIKPDYVPSLNNSGNIYLEHGKLDEAIARYTEALRIQPAFVDALNNLGLAFSQQHKLDDAIAKYTEALRIKPGFVDALNNLGLAFHRQGRLDDAVACYTEALRIKPDDHRALNNLGNTLKLQGKLDGALARYTEVLGIKPDYHPALNNLGNILKEQGQLNGAIACYTEALRIKPDYPHAQSQLIALRREICDWRQLHADQSVLTELVRRKADEVDPFSFLAAASTLAEQLTCAQTWSAMKTAAIRPLPEPRPIRRHQRIRIGYLSADFHRHATAYLMAELFERHDRAQFEISGYSYGPDDGSPMRTRLVAGFDHFVDIRPMTPALAATVIRNHEIDILVDLKGFTQYARPEILAYRPAPIQVNYLGYPGTMGSDFIDYIVADPIVAPMDEQIFYSERIVHLPECYQPNDTRRALAETTPSRADCGLPEAGLVFCCFNNSYKITPALFEIWMRLLAAVPDSVLWLLEANASIKDHLRREAVARGIAPERLVFAPRWPLAEHLARHRLASLFLDTLPYNAHTTASDALWAGLPVLTCSGGTFAGRVAASLLQAIGMPELITTSLEDYHATALILARDPARLAALKDKLADHRRVMPLFNIGRFTVHLEQAYRHMWDLWCSGKPPNAFAVKSIAP